VLEGKKRLGGILWTRTDDFAARKEEIARLVAYNKGKNQHLIDSRWLPVTILKREFYHVPRINTDNQRSSNDPSF